MKPESDFRRLVGYCAWRALKEAADSEDGADTET
jgi:hypothetical protein